jgi:superfamily II DNA/RNA helicase
MPADVTFADLGVPPAISTSLAGRSITSPRPIQAQTLPDALAGRDILGRAETGSGKTLAFGIPMLTRLAPMRRDRRSRRPHGLVLVPTRELATQVRDELSPLAAALGLKVLAVYGGASIRTQINALQRGVDVVVATPGRLQDLIKQHACNLDSVAVTALDEADHMADLGFLPVVTWLLDKVPAGGQRLLFSATLDNEVDTLVRRYLVDPASIAIESATHSPSQLDHQFQTVAASSDKVDAAAELIGKHGRTLLFTRTKHGADRLARQLGRAGVRAGALHGNLTQGARQRALSAFSTGAVPVLVATDIAARGIHVDGIDLVIHFDPPAEAKAYLHRSGRTARSGAAGTVVTLVLPEQRSAVERLRRGAGLAPASSGRPSGGGYRGNGSRPSRPSGRRPEGVRRDGHPGAGSGGPGGSGRPRRRRRPASY